MASSSSIITIFLYVYS